jgi:hypothetical protein
MHEICQIIHLWQLEHVKPTCTHTCKHTNAKETLETSENINQIKITRLSAASVSDSLPPSIALLLILYPEAAKRSVFAASVSLSPYVSVYTPLLLPETPFAASVSVSVSVYCSASFSAS